MPDRKNWLLLFWKLAPNMPIQDTCAEWKDFMSQRKKKNPPLLLQKPFLNSSRLKRSWMTIQVFCKGSKASLLFVSLLFKNVIRTNKVKRMCGKIFKCVHWNKETEIEDFLVPSGLHLFKEEKKSVFLEQILLETSNLKSKGIDVLTLRQLMAIPDVTMEIPLFLQPWDVDKRILSRSNWATSYNC